MKHRTSHWVGQNYGTWNEKNLDYEIETHLEKNSRKPILTWNEKNLDYEIETIEIVVNVVKRHTSWNEKNLDYEIETDRKWDVSRRCT